MKVDAKKLDALIKCAKYLKKLEVSYQRNSSVAAIMNADTSIKKRNAAFNKMEMDAEAIEDQLHELHCLAVEIGVAERDESRYGEKIVAGGRSIERIFFKREPKKTEIMPVIVNFDELIYPKSVQDMEAASVLTEEEWSDIVRYRQNTSLSGLTLKTKVSELTVRHLTDLAFVLFDDKEKIGDGYLCCHVLNRIFDRLVDIEKHPRQRQTKTGFFDGKRE